MRLCIAGNCKIWDYLAMGTPIISDQVAGGTELIEQTGCGIVVETEPFSDAVIRAKNIQFPRAETRTFMRQQHTWEVTVDGWIHHLREALS